MVTLVKSGHRRILIYVVEGFLSRRERGIFLCICCVKRFKFFLFFLYIEKVHNLIYTNPSIQTETQWTE